MTRRRHRHRRRFRIARAALHLAAVGFLTRVIVPVGYMPAPLAEGGPFAPCHGSYFGRFVKVLSNDSFSAAAQVHHSDPAAPHHEKTEDAGGVHEAWEHCPLGVVAAGAALGLEHTLKLAELDQDFTHPGDVVVSSALVVGLYRARAPPA